MLALQGPGGRAAVSLLPVLCRLRVHQAGQYLSSRPFSSDDKDDKGKKEGSYIQGIFQS
jgi:hypothetical protein